MFPEQGVVRRSKPSVPPRPRTRPARPKRVLIVWCALAGAVALLAALAATTGIRLGWRLDRQVARFRRLNLVPSAGRRSVFPGAAATQGQ